jgi:TonB family protein
MRAVLLGLVLLGGLLAASQPAWSADRAATKKVAPTYPALAKRMHVAGTVKMEVKVDAAGKVQDVKVLSGHPLLGPAAKECVQQWQFAPADTDGTVVIELEFKM